MRGKEDEERTRRRGEGERAREEGGELGEKEGGY
jgi:hypothetical protein